MLSSPNGLLDASGNEATVVNNTAGASAVNIQDGGNSITVDQATGTNLHTVLDSGTLTTVSTVTNIAQQGGVAISLNTGVRDTGTQRVTIATNDLVPISAASLPLPTGAATSALQTQPGVDIGDVTVNNAAGAAAVNIQDGGNSITVDGTVTINQPAAGTATGTLNALNSTVTLDVSKYIAASFVISVTGYTATVTTQGSSDGGTNWDLIGFCTVNATTIGTALTFPNTTGTFTRIFTGGAGLTHVRLIATAFTGGTATATITGTSFLGDTKNISVVGTITNTVVTSQILSAKQVYSANINNLTPPATPTDMVTITGSATATVKVLAMELMATTTAAGTQTFFIVKRSTANTVGTSTSPTNVPHDSNDAASTAVVRSYTANPTPGVTVGTVDAKKIFTPAVSSVTTPYLTIFDFTRDGLDQGIVLRGTSQVLALNFAGAALPAGLNLTVNIVWVEE